MTHFTRAETLATFAGAILDCRFALTDSAAGRQAYDDGHIPGAQHLDLNAHMSAPVEEHGGRHPLPTPAAFAAALAARGVGPDSEVLLYDDSRFVFAARAWWMLRALGYGRVKVLDGGYRAWLAAGGTPTRESAVPAACDLPPVPPAWPLCCDREGLLAEQAGGACVIDAREGARYRGEHEPIDPVAGHIAGAENLPWQSFSDEQGFLRSDAALRELWGERLEARPLIVYCGSGVSACVNILSLAELGRADVWLYGGSWSDWCSYL